MDKHRCDGGECFLEVTSAKEIFSDVSRVAGLCRNGMSQHIYFDFSVGYDTIRGIPGIM